MTNDKKTGRREFVQRMWTAGLVAVGTAALGVTFWDRKGPTGVKATDTRLELADYTADVPMGKIAVARGSDRRANVQAAVKALGGMDLFVRAGDKVLLKVNAAFATPPALGATTHPDVVEQVAKACFEAGAGEVVVADNPINDPASCFSLTGIAPAARKAGGRVMLPRPDRFEPFTLKEGQLIRNWPVFGAPLRWADKVIGLAPVKDHHRSGASMGIKNWYGLLGGRRNIFHQQIHTIITDLALMIKPTLVILDGTWTMMANGPTGGSMDDLKHTRTVVAGTDPVAVDAFGATLLGKSAEDLPHLKMAQAAGAGTTDYRSLNPIEVNASG